RIGNVLPFVCHVCPWGPLGFGHGWQRIRTAVEAVMKTDYTDQVVRPALGEWVDGLTWTRSPTTWRSGSQTPGTWRVAVSRRVAFTHEIDA
ncbi:hypothetical protein U6T54_12700, partial [Cutibacterium acnes]